MPVDVSEWTLLNVLQAGIAAVQTDPATAVPALFPQVPATLQQQIIASLGPGGSLATIAVLLAYLPNTAPKLPSVYLYGVPGGEVLAEDVIGSRWGQTGLPNAGGVTTLQGIMSRKAWQITCATVNLTDLLVLVGLVKTALLAARPTLGSAPNGYIEQLLTWSGWSPMANSAGDVIFPFQQTLTFTVTTVESAAVSNAAVITGITPIVLTPTGEEGS